MDPLAIVAIGAALLVGALGQRIVGMGFGLIAMPVLVLTLGPLPAVVAVNAFGAMSTVLVMTRTWGLIDWRRLWWMLVPAVAGAIAGILLARGASSDLLKAIVGALIVVAILLTLVRRRDARPIDGPGVLGGGGLVVGALTGSLGVGAPVLGILGLVTQWEPRAFGATLQPFFCALSTVVVAAKVAIDPHDAPPWPWWGWLLAAVPLVVGFVVGDRVAAHVPTAAIRCGILAISLAGSVIVLVSGVAGMLA